MQKQRRRIAESDRRAADHARFAAVQAGTARPFVAHGDLPFRSIIPRPGPWREHLLHVFAGLTIGYGLYYLTWRWTTTLNPAALWIAVPLVAAESIAYVTTALLVFNTWRLRHRAPAPPPPGLAVDVFVTTYDEPVEVVRKTVRAARDIRYPHRTWILDDGRRLEMARLARELGVEYLTRSDNHHAKAGNLNHALEQTDGEFILQLDADHVPLPHMLDRLLGYLTDPQVAFAQAPQNFHNLDAFSTHLDVESRRFLNDQDIFFEVIQPGKDNWNAAFFCGSCAVLRRSAIEDVGGFSTKTITEDIETSLQLHAHGWKSVYHGEALAYGLAPRTASAFHLQRLRWARGGMQLLRHFNPLFVRGLSVPQRLSYLSSVLHPIDGPVRLTFIAAPLIYLAAGVYPIRSFGLDFLVHFLPYLALLLALHQLLGRGRSGPLWFLDFGAIARMLTQTVSLAAYFTGRRLRFRVTPKGIESGGWLTHAPHALLFLASLGAVGWGTAVFVSDWLARGPEGIDGLAFLVNLSWATWNAAIIGLVVKASLASRQRRPTARFDEYLPFRFRVVQEDGTTGPAVAAITEDINGEGLAFRSLEAVPVGATVLVKLPLLTGAVSLEGRVLHERADRLGSMPVYRYGAAFLAVPETVRDAIDLHCTQHAVPAGRSLSTQSQKSDPFGDAIRWFRDPRRDERVPVRLPVKLRLEQTESTSDSRLAVLEDMSRYGARLLTDDPIPVNTSVSWQVPGTTYRGHGRVVRTRALDTPLGRRYVIGAVKDKDTTLPVAGRTGKRSTPIKKVAMIAGLLATLKRFMFAGLAAGSLVALQANSVSGQVGRGFLGAGEAASDGQNLILLGAWINGTGGDWRPVAGVIGHRLEYESGGTDVIVWTANPYVGVRRQWQDGGLQFNVGYSLQDAPQGVSGVRQTTSGMTAAVQADRGNAGPTLLQAIASASAGDGGYIWSRLRVAQRAAFLDNGPFRLGVEATAQGGDTYRAFEVGPIISWPIAQGTALVMGAGFRRAEPAGSNASGHGYVRFDIVVIPH